MFGVWTVVLVIWTTPCASAGESWEAMRKAALDRKREVIYSTDGNDALFFKKDMAATRENFEGIRLAATRGSRIDTIYYCPQCSPFCTFTYDTDAGDRYLTTTPHIAQRGMRNVTAEFIAQGTSPLRLAEEFCKREGKEFFITIRMNDTHDSAGAKSGYGPWMFDACTFKKEHPEYLCGVKGTRQPCGTWTAIDFTHRAVRDRLVACVKEMCEKFDPDGIDYDFFRHMQYLKSVSQGGEASADEIALLTEMMRELRAVTESAGRKRGRPVLVSVRVADDLGYSRAVGLDWEAWLEEGLVDILSTTGYFQLRPIRYSAEIAKRHGARYYVSMDESRIPGFCERSGKPIIPGRGSKPFYWARTAAALASGSDGALYFNIDLGGRIDTDKATGTWREVDGKDKFYFPVERGSGGFRPEGYVKDGYRKYSTLLDLDPGRGGCRLRVGERLAFDMCIGDDPSKLPAGRRMAVEAKILVSSARDAVLAMAVNGRSFTNGVFNAQDGTFDFAIPADAVKFGDNRIEITVQGGTSANAVDIGDFRLGISYAASAVHARRRNRRCRRRACRPGSSSR